MFMLPSVLFYHFQLELLLIIQEKRDVDKEKLTSTTGSHAKFFESEDVSPNIPVGGPRKLSQTSRKRDSSASLQ